MENTFIVRYRCALHKLKEAYRLQYALVDESDALRTLAYKQAYTVEKAILKNRKSGRGFLISRLRECLDEEPHALVFAERISREIERMEGRYDSEVSKEEADELHLVIEEAIGGLLEVFGSQFPKMLTGAAIVTYRGNVPVSELVLKFGPTHLQLIVGQRLKAAADNPAELRKQSAALEKGKKVLFCNGFRPEDADSVAREISLIDENGNIDATLTYKGGRLCGFYKQLKTAKKVNGSLEILRDYFAERYKMEAITSKPNPKAYIAMDTARETETALERLFLK